MKDKREASPLRAAYCHQEHGRPGLDHQAVPVSPADLHACRCFKTGIAAKRIKCFGSRVDMKRRGGSGQEHGSQVLGRISPGRLYRKGTDG